MAQQLERRLLGEWLWEFHRETPVIYNAPMGDYNVEKGYKIYNVKAPRADAIYLEDDEIYIVEAKVVDEFKGIAELENYKRLFKRTAHFMPWHDKKVNLILLVAREKPDVTEMCEEKDILKVIYTPDWVKEYLVDLVKRKRQR